MALSFASQEHLEWTKERGEEARIWNEADLVKITQFLVFPQWPKSFVCSLYTGLYYPFIEGVYNKPLIRISMNQSVYLIKCQNGFERCSFWVWSLGKGTVATQATSRTERNTRLIATGRRGKVTFTARVQWNSHSARFEMDVSENNGTPKIIHFNMVFHYKPSIWGTPILGNTKLNTRCLSFAFKQGTKTGTKDKTSLRDGLYEESLSCNFS